MKNDKSQVNRKPQESSNGLPAVGAGDHAENQYGVTDEEGKRATASLKKIEANRRNARNSTGPKTARGKRTVAANAVTHGFFSKFVLIPHRDGNESQNEYDNFYATVRKHYQPDGWLEEYLVERVAVCSWRLRRLIRCESGQIARALAGNRHELQQSRADDLSEPESAPSSDPEMDSITDHLILPEKDELDKLLRYEARIDRQLNHAISELERLQARRKGGPSIL